LVINKEMPVKQNLEYIGFPAALRINTCFFLSFHSGFCQYSSSGKEPTGVAAVLPSSLDVRLVSLNCDAISS
jgi:hypothetical protein